MNHEWSPLSEDAGKEEVERRLVWCKGYIKACERNISMEESNIRSLKEDIEELNDLLLGADE